jgi:hypothetical protein
MKICVQKKYGNFLGGEFQNGELRKVSAIEEDERKE